MSGFGEHSSAAQPSTCYRHPNEVSYVLCQRCTRIICYHCQTQAAVGVICPECIAEQKATAPVYKKPSAIKRLFRSHHAAVTVSIIAICGVVFLLQSLPVIGADIERRFLYAGIYSTAIAFEPWRMLTTMFLHGSLIHFFFNMYTLWIFGSILEPMLGRARFVALYIMSGFAGSLGVLFLVNPLQGVVGASGAIFGLFGAFFIIFRKLGQNPTQIVVLVAINLAIGFLPGMNIAWQAHLGGLLGGFLVGYIFMETRSAAREKYKMPLLVALGGILLGLSFIPLMS